MHPVHMTMITSLSAVEVVGLDLPASRHLTEHGLLLPKQLLVATPLTGNLTPSLKALCLPFYPYGRERFAVIA